MDVLCLAIDRIVRGRFEDAMFRVRRDMECERPGMRDQREGRNLSNMRIRQLIAAFMIFTSFVAQARVEFACGMSPGTNVAHHCCPPGEPAPCAAGIGEKACCDKVATSDAPLGHVSTAGEATLHGTLDFGQLPPTILPPDFSLVPAVLEVASRYHPPLGLDAGRNRVRPLYLQTARLRL